MKQYELWRAELPEPIGRRPVLLLSRTPSYAYLAKVIVAEVTSTIRGIPQEVALSKREGLSQRSVANLDNLHVVPRTLLTKRLGTILPGRVWEVKRALGYALDWPELKVVVAAER